LGNIKTLKQCSKNSFLYTRKGFSGSS